jgi:hypothetical protein
MPFNSLSSAAIAPCVLLLLAAGCSGATSPGGDASGSLALDLTVLDDFEIDEVLWRISGGTQGMPAMDGAIDTSAPGSTASVEVFGLPADAGYLIEMEARSTDGGLTCRGSAGFDVTAGEATPVHLMLNCKERVDGVDEDTEFNPESCETVEGTLDIHWEAVGGAYAPCMAIEMTDGTLADAADGTAAFKGVAVSDPKCIGMDVYEFAVSEDGLTLSGTAFASEVEVDMVFTRLPDESCFVGHWVLRDQDYLGHIAAAPFGVVVSP